MALVPGTRLGPYEIHSPLGAGGMGEVYRAHDTKLGRDVALKVVAESFARDPERSARFHREAQLLAALNHPHIATIHGLEEAGGTRFFVMELVEGETLADRLSQERGGLPLDEALRIARQVADALQAAHDRGIIHRDLKPANIALTADGQVKVLDFGLAKALDPVPGSDVSASPTLSFAATQIGVVLGTAAYMAPEQARGKPTDKRADIWAFGCVLYEMLTGKRAFDGEDVTVVLASVIKGEPDWAALPANVPAPIVTLLRGCLEKERRSRVSDIGAAIFVLDHAARLGGPSVAPALPAERVVPRWRRTAPLAASLVLGAVGAGGTVWVMTRPESPRVVRTVLTAPESAALVVQGNDRDVAISRDGSRIVYRGNNQLLVRNLNRLEPTVLGGLGAPRGPFISPDGQWIGFFDPNINMLKKVAITGGPAVSLCATTPNPRGGTWGDDGTVVFATADTTLGLQRVSAAGGEPTVLTKPDPARGETDHIWPEFLPGGEAVLFTITSAESGIDNSQIAVLDLRSNTYKVLVRGGSHAQYLPTGHLVFGSGGTLRAVPFDLARLEVTGTPVPVLEGVVYTPSGTVDAVVGMNGTLMYVAGTVTTPRVLSTLAWVDRRGGAKPLIAREASYRAPRISPDVSRIAVSILAQDGNEDVWVIDSERGTQTRLTSEREVDALPLWTPDGKRIVFSTVRTGTANSLYWMPADGSGSAEVLTQATSNQGATSWFPDGSVVAFYDVGNTYDIFTLKPGATPVRFLETKFREQGAVFSPDGRWIAYSSDETGRAEIYVAPYPGPGGKIAVSAAGGRSPRWSSDGKELVYRNARQMMAVAVTPGPTLGIGSPRLLFEGEYAQEEMGQGAHNYDVTADGQRFIMMLPVAQTERAEARREMVVVQNWFEELKRLVPAN